MGLAFVLLSDRKGTHSFHGKKKKKVGMFLQPPLFPDSGKGIGISIRPYCNR